MKGTHLQPLNPVEFAPAYGTGHEGDTGAEVQCPLRDLQPGMRRPRVLSSAEVLLSSASSVLRPDLPGSVPPRDFTLCADTQGPAVHGCSRRGRSRSQLCIIYLSPVPLSIRRKSPRVHVPVSSSRIPTFAHPCRARPLVCPTLTSVGYL